MSVDANIVTQAKDISELLECVAKILRSHSKQRWSLILKLAVEKGDCYQ